MYSATCPRCGTTIYSTVLGQAWLACQTCQYFGMLVTTVQPTQAASQVLISAPSQAPTQAALPSPAPSSTPAAADSLLWTLQQHAQHSGAEVAVKLAALTPQDYQLPLTQVWDRMQQATEALYHSLGERRMGDYPPDIESVSRALTQIGAWHIIALHAARRLHESGEGA